MRAIVVNAIAMLGLLVFFVLFHTHRGSPALSLTGDSEVVRLLIGAGIAGLSVRAWFLVNRLSVFPGRSTSSSRSLARGTAVLVLIASGCYLVLGVLSALLFDQNALEAQYDRTPGGMIAIAATGSLGLALFGSIFCVGTQLLVAERAWRWIDPATAPRRGQSVSSWVVACLVLLGASVAVAGWSGASGRDVPWARWIYLTAVIGFLVFLAQAISMAWKVTRITWNKEYWNERN